jgi:hypothetical protein
MAVEIQILSGARQGERIELAADSFQAGDVPGCDVYFDPRQDPGARSRVASFRLKDDGWYLASSSGGELMVNDRPVIGVARIRSGDVVRLSDRGPDFSFNILVGRSASAPAYASLKPLVAPIQPVAVVPLAARESTPSPSLPSAAMGVPQPASPGSASGFGSCPAPNTPAMAPALPPAASPLQLSQGLILALAGVVLCCMVFLGGLALVVMMNRGAPAAAPPSPAVVVAVDQAPKSPRKPAEPQNVADAAVPAPVVEPAPSNPDEITDPIFKPLRGCVYLLAVENSKQQKTWPFATACAIRQDTLLCCANAAVELIKFKTMGLTCWASNQSTLTKVEIGDIHVHALFQKLNQDFGKRMYFDFALLTVRGKLPQIAPLASVDELDDLKGGTPVVSLSIPHQGELMDRFQSFSPVLTRAKVFIITTLPPAPGPRLMHMKAVMPVNIYGSPVFNTEGKVVGVYSDVATPPPGQPPVANLNLHFVPVVSPELITSWFEGSGKEVWIPVTAPESAPQPINASPSTTAAKSKKRP